MKNCELCNSEHDGSIGSGRFCSLKCSRSYATKAKRNEISAKVSAKLRKPLETKECEECGKTFIKKRKVSRFCNTSCAFIFVNKAGRSTKAGQASAAVRILRSKNEIEFSRLCKEYFDEVLENPKMFNGWDADIVIPNLKLAILWNGKWHYEKITKKHSLEQVQNRDRLKAKAIEECGYDLYVIKDMGKFDPEFVKKEFEIFKQLIEKK